MFNRETVVHLIGDPCLKLYRHGKGYWYFGITVTVHSIDTSRRSGTVIFALDGLLR
jgi:hypothetical protein